MSQLVRVFKPDGTAIWVFKAMILFGLSVAFVGFFGTPGADLLRGHFSPHHFRRADV